ncbi:putative ABC transporter permease protein [Kineosphaera limosa NBRC 100340]|uniref:Putative ABC transporter permease protein n=2 Tax=Kineosphaera TaxID=211469 RepID=K6W8U7_9MICO|nr:iron chelate uptake ABC transporter family permease subunit [Kineosphaera limosa]GAB95620.1 putative ABC transporter permease protein [Kineosphaera limosa NBRC 100340]
MLAIVVVLSLAVGARTIPPATVWEALVDPRPTPEHATIWDGRIPRTLLGIVAGVALGVAGALIQGLTRNPLADPGVLGVNAGAAFFVVIAVGFLGVASISGYVWFAFAGAFVSSVAVYLIGTGGRRDVNPMRLTLAGVALGAVLTGIGSGIALLRPEAFAHMRAWNVGSLDVRSLEPLMTIAPFVLTGLVLAAVASRGLDALAMGEDVAQALGSSVLATRLCSVVAITLLAGAATAATGAIAFVGLMIPHVARRLCGPDQRWIVVFTIVLAPILLLSADVLGRVAVPGEMQAGVVTAFVGAPFLIAIARRRRVIAL